MKPTNLTNIDFDEIRESIKSYMRTRPEFSDYDFTGSTLSYLVDILAYNSYYSAFNANMALNETFLDSASIRDNVVSLAKLLNYTPRSATAARACISLTMQTQIGVNGQYPLSAVLKKGPVASGNGPTGNFTFNVLEDIEATVDSGTGIAVFDSITIYEGNLLDYSFTVDTTSDQRYIIPNNAVDVSTLKVSVRPNQQSTLSDSYNLVKNITSIESDTRVYFLSETEDRRYEINFGDGIIGKELVQGEVIDVEYIRTNGKDANNISVFKYVGVAEDINGVVISNANLTMREKSQLGASQETVKSIKFNAPKYYAAQNRAVTAQDYANITKSIYPNAKYVSAYGGESLTPPVYGKVYISIRTQTGAKLNNLSKQEIIRNLRPYSMASVDVVITDPNEIFIGTNILIVANSLASSFGDGTLTQTTSDRLKNKALAALQEYGDEEDLNNFNKTFSLQKLSTTILKSDDQIVDVLANMSLYKRTEYPDISGPKTYIFEFGTTLNCSCNTSPGKTILSSVFYTKDRPAVPQYFEDDGNGYLRSFTTINNKKTILSTNVGTYDCDTGKVIFGPVELEGIDTLESTITTIDPSATLTTTINEFFEDNTSVPGNLISPQGDQYPGELIKSSSLPDTYIFIGDDTNANPGQGDGYIFVAAAGWSIGPGYFTPTSQGSGILTFTGSPVSAAGTSAASVGGGTGGSTSTGTGLSGTIPSSITVSVAPGNTSITPGNFVSGAVMGFFTPAVTTTVAGGSSTSLNASVASTFPTGGTLGTPSTYVAPTTSVLNFSPSYALSLNLGASGGAQNTCFI